MKAAFTAALFFGLLVLCIPWAIQPDNISVLAQPKSLTKLTSATPFDFPQQWRKTKRDSDELIRSKEGFISRMQGITPLWACVYSRDNHTVEYPIIRAGADGGFIVGCTHFYRPSYDMWAGIIKLSSHSSIEWQNSYSTDYQLNMVKCIEQTNDGGYIVGMRSRLDEHGFLILKLSADGSIEWAHGYTGGGEDPTSIKQTKDGGYIITGLTRALSDPRYYDDETGYIADLLVIKLKPNGDVEWQRAIGGPEWESDWPFSERAVTVLESSQGGYLVVTDTPSFSDNEWPDLWAIKFSELGDVEWQRVFRGKKIEWLLNPGPHAVETTDGKYVIACTTWSYGVVIPDTNSRYSEIWLIKLKPNGDVEWQKTYGEKGSETVRALQATSDGGCIVAGGSNSWSGSNVANALVFKIAPAGNVLWQHTYGGEGHDEATSVCTTSDNGIAIAGYTYSFAIEKNDLLVLKLTSDGKLDPVCSDLVAEPEIVVMDTDCIPFDTYRIARVTDAGKTTPRINTEMLNLKKNVVCWNLNQPPINVSFERMENKSFFVSEAWHTITWSPNPYNSDNGFAIEEYKIYRRERDDADDDYSAFQQIGIVPGNMYIFVDEYIQPDKQYQYAVTSVDSEGNESPKSEAVGNVS